MYTEYDKPWMRTHRTVGAALYGAPSVIPWCGMSGWTPGRSPGRMVFARASDAQAKPVAKHAHIVYAEVTCVGQLDGLYYEVRQLRK